MAKELPYFKFEPNAWENGNIQVCSRQDKGLFIDLCSMYWSRLGDLPKKLVIQKLCAGNATALNSLCDEKIIEVIDGNIYIKFLSEQLNEFEDTSKQNSKNAKEGWIKRRKQKELCEKDATALNPQCESDAIREEKRREEKRRKENKIKSFEIFWNLYQKKNDREKTQKAFLKLSEIEIEAILKAVPIYVKSTPDVKFRKNATTWINGKCWEDEIISTTENVKNNYEVKNAFGREILFKTEAEIKELCKNGFNSYKLIS